MSHEGRISRRNLLAKSAVGIAATAMTSTAAANALNDGDNALSDRRRTAEQLRTSTARYYGSRSLPYHRTNGDEEALQHDKHPTYLGNYSKGLPHNPNGEVDPEAYETLLEALTSGEPEAFERVPLGGLVGNPLNLNIHSQVAKIVPQQGKRFYRVHSERALISSDIPQIRLTNPQAGLAYDLEGPDSHQLVMPPPPAFRGKEIISEIAENYWMALARDVAFLKYESDADVKKSVDDLSKYAEFKGPKDGGAVTPDTVFRGSTLGDRTGPYVSQFLVRMIPFGAYRVDQKVVYGFKPDANGERVFLINEEDYLAAQRGIASPPVERIEKPTYIYRGRDLANFVHIDELFQAYLNAALILSAGPDRFGLGAPHDEGNPYDGFAGIDPADGSINHKLSKQAGFGTLGQPNIASMVAEVATRALKAVWYQKWVVHRRLRPEAFAGHLHFHRTKDLKYPFDPAEYEKLKDVLDAVFKYNAARGGNGYFLPMAFPEGSPTHPSYGAGHATVAAACTTILKAFYQTDVTFKQLRASIFLANETGTDLIELSPKNDAYGNYKYSELADKMTIGGELNKVASNVSLGRNFAGVHWRSDHAESLRLGEEVAIQFLRETVPTYNERVSFGITRFDETRTTVANF